MCISSVLLIRTHFLGSFQPGKVKRKFSSFFKSLVIELDKDLYGPDNHLVEVSFRPLYPQRVPIFLKKQMFMLNTYGDCYSL